MYKNFFGFNEKPFKLVPNPAYLFLSKSHEEALAHLTYAVLQGEGFMEITGEVGTGKTTLCRAFLEHLNEDTKAAYIFNPNLNSIELLKTINDEFGISSNADNLKDLMDTLNAFLIEQKSKAKNTILLIDEAQNLTHEVLEQLRLLSNLETARHKLLHIILVGQPELKEKLDSHELRQLRQRISLSCRLVPLSFKDVRNYIQHRLNVASGEKGIEFDDAAYRSIYNYSKGVPRLINIACDRALLTAFGLDQKEITQKIVKASIKELTDSSDMDQNSFKKRKMALLFFSILSLLILMVAFFYPRSSKKTAIFNSTQTKTQDIFHSKNTEKPEADKNVSKVKTQVHDISIAVKKESAKEVTLSKTKKIVPDATSSEPEKPFPVVTDSKPKEIKAQKIKAPEPVTKPTRDLGNLLKKMNRLASRHTAIKVALNLWNIEPKIESDLAAIDNDQDFFRRVSNEHHLLLRRITGNLNAVKRLNLPAILAVHLDKSVSPVYLTLINIDSQKITLRGGKQDISIELLAEELESHWSGVAFIPWKNFLSLKGTIPINSPKVSITTLKMLLRDIGFKDVKINPYYDDNTRRAVKEIQKKYGLHIDGTVGSTTKIALYNEKKGVKQPHIVNAKNSFIR